MLEVKKITHLQHNQEAPSLFLREGGFISMELMKTEG
jgi:hypothetical protein